jgi:hypothetical protein
LPPAPVIDVRLVDENQPRRHRENPYHDHELRSSVIASRCVMSFRGWKHVSAPPRFASPLTQGERTRVKGFRHGTDVPNQTVTLTSGLRGDFYLAPKAISQTSPPQDGFAVANLGRRTRN